MKLLQYIILFLSILFLSSCNDEQEEGTIRFGICSDVHLPTMHDSEKRITTFIDSMKSLKPDFIIELGDFVIPDKKYDHMYSIWNLFPEPKYHVIGNHEMDGGTSLKEALAYREMENSFYTFSNSGFKFIVLDSNDKKYEDQKGYRSFIGKKQIHWLEGELANAENPIVIFSHQGIGTDPKNPGERYSIENSEEVRKILETHNKFNTQKVIACFNGHTHHDYAEEINEIWYITINSMAYKWLGEEYEYIRYNEEVDKDYKWIKYTAPYKDPLFAVVEISTSGYIKISGKKSEYVGPSPWELGYPEHLKKYVRPQITSKTLKFSLNSN